MVDLELFRREMTATGEQGAKDADAMARGILRALEGELARALRKNELRHVKIFSGPRT